MVRVLSVISITIVTLLAGCSTPQSRPLLTDAGYAQFANRIVGLRKCAEEGRMTPETASLGIQYTRNTMNTWLYSDAFLNPAIARAEKNPAPTNAACTNAAIEIATTTRSVERGQAAAAASNKQWDDLVKTTAPAKPIYCNKAGTMVACQ
jgi:hypothetical protein